MAYKDRTFSNEHTQYVYTIEDLECIFTASDEFKAFSEAEQAYYNENELFTIVFKAHDNYSLQKMFEAFCAVSTDYIGISEGEEFCNLVGYDDLYKQIHDTFWKI